MTDETMLKVFIVEDELLIRETLRNILSTYEESHHVVYAGEASDGEIALSMMREIKPDILLTDIRMPFMDGLTLSKYAKELFPWLHIVIISGYQDFPYLQEAISLGVEGYLTKPIRPDELSDVLDRIRVNQEKKNAEQESPLRQEIIIDFEYYKEHFINKLKEERYTPNELFDREKRLNFTFVGKSFTTMVAKLSVPPNNKQCFFQLTTRFSELFQKDEHVLLTVFDDFTITCLIAGDTAKESLNKAYYVADIMQYEIFKLAIDSFMIGIGSTTNRISELSAAIQKSEDALALTTFPEQTHIMELTVPTSRVPEKFSSPLIKLLEDNAFDQSKIMSEIEHLQYANDDTAQMALNQAILDTVFLWIKQMDEDSYLELKKDYPKGDLELICQTPSLFKLTCRVLLEEIDRLKNHEQLDSLVSRTNRLVKKCIAYLQENYNDPNISLQTLANLLELSPAYLSTIFSQTEGVTLIEYLTNLRLEHAKELLKTTQMKIIDITFEIGYSDPNYFSFTFKKKNGLSPKEYRKEQQK